MRIFRKKDKFIFQCSYDQRAIPKSAGFLWDPIERVWYTKDKGKVLSLIDYADDKVKSEFLNGDKVEKRCDNEKLYPFQREGVDWLVSRKVGLLADDMGLGKTVQIIEAINLIPHSSILIVCPASVKLVWERELKKWYRGGCKVEVVRAGDKVNGLKDKILIVNYDIISRYREFLLIDWDVVVLDEAHYIKNPKAKRTKFITSLIAKRKYLLTATPILSKPIELYPLLDFLQPGEWGKYWDFARRYCEGHYEFIYTKGGRQRRVFVAEGCSNEEELKTLMKPIMLKRYKYEVLRQLPEKEKRLIEVEGKGDIEVLARVREKVAFAKKRAGFLKENGEDEAYKEAMVQLRGAIMEGIKDLSEARRETAKQKIPFIKQIVEDSVESGNSVVVFAHYHEIIKLLCQEIGAPALYGATSQEERKKIIDGFQKEDFPVLVCGIRAAGFGITLHRASHIVFAELDWVPSVMEQCEDRAHRIGQENRVIVDYVVVNNSIDAIIAKTNLKKKKVIERCIDKFNSFLYYIDMSEDMSEEVRDELKEKTN